MSASSACANTRVSVRANSEPLLTQNNNNSENNGVVNWNVTETPFYETAEMYASAWKRARASKHAGAEKKHREGV